jgi:prevent-host-death family protein
MTMKGVGIADLKARLSEHLKAVRRGRTLTVLDRQTPVAQIVPYASEAVEIRRATRSAKDVRRGAPASRRTNSLAVLLDDRARR